MKKNNEKDCFKAEIVQLTTKLETLQNQVRQLEEERDDLKNDLEEREKQIMVICEEMKDRDYEIDEFQDIHDELQDEND